MRAVVWSDDALDDMDSAVRYIANDSYRAATLVVDRIEATIELLAEYPTGRAGRVKGTYEKPVHRTPYIVAYALSDTRVVVLRVIYGSRDWPEGEWPPE
ncbi:MAG: type II toxin-antitoxin system RelE/ParE family toxin [Rhizobiaceae bacterium]|nr:type II toxin-antitoxin system RelE/ParE family toxin [Rhizobiaceae bacterium]MCV0406035.1 type II toxin-antitoxin system RelE/ParE family toxin [Rhizobiaceae bacterium]